MPRDRNNSTHWTDRMTRPLAPVGRLPDPNAPPELNPIPYEQRFDRSHYDPTYAPPAWARQPAYPRPVPNMTDRMRDYVIAILRQDLSQDPRFRGLNQRSLNDLIHQALRRGAPNETVYQAIMDAIRVAEERVRADEREFGRRGGSEAAFATIDGLPVTDAERELVLNARSANEGITRVRRHRAMFGLQPAGGNPRFRHGAHDPQMDRDLPRDGDVYVDTRSGDVWMRQGGTMHIQASVRGETGASGYDPSPSWDESAAENNRLMRSMSRNEASRRTFQELYQQNPQPTRELTPAEQRELRRSANRGTLRVDNVRTGGAITGRVAHAVIVDDVGQTRSLGTVETRAPTLEESIHAELEGNMPTGLEETQVDTSTAPTHAPGSYHATLARRSEQAKVMLQLVGEMEREYLVNTILSFLPLEKVDELLAAIRRANPR